METLNILLRDTIASSRGARYVACLFDPGFEAALSANIGVHTSGVVSLRHSNKKELASCIKPHH